MTTLSHLLCQGLIDAGVDTLYCLPGVQNDDFFNVLVDHPDLRPVVTRHEQACSYMATGAALATGRPQAYCTVPGQGVLNAAAGHSTAYATSARVLALLGQNKREFIGRMHGQLHELPNQMAVVDQLSKHAVGLRDDAAAPGQIAGALAAFLGGNPKPVTIECPLDMWKVPGHAGARARGGRPGGRPGRHRPRRRPAGERKEPHHLPGRRRPRRAGSHRPDRGNAEMPGLGAPPGQGRL